MAACYESLTFDRCNALLAFAARMKISKVWQSVVEPCVFLELGRLTRRSTPLGDRIHGRATLMIESDWRVEKPRSIHFGSSFSQRKLARLLPGLVNLRVAGLSVETETREVCLRFSDRRALRTFTDWDTRPRWSVGVNDSSLLALDAVWADVDVTPHLHMRSGRPCIEYCFDEARADLKALRRLYQFPRGSG